MSDINEVITLGIGTPSDIPHFILFGLSPNTAPPPNDHVYIYIDGEAMMWPSVSSEAIARPAMSTEALARPAMLSEAIARPTLTAETFAQPSISGETFHVH